MANTGGYSKQFINYFWTEPSCIFSNLVKRELIKVWQVAYSVSLVQITYAIVLFIDALKQSSSTTKSMSIVNRVNEFFMFLRKEGD